MLTVSIRAAVLYLGSVLCVRLMGKRQLGQLQPYEWVMALLIADLAASPMENVETPLLYGLLPMVMLLSLYALLTYLNAKCPPVRKLLCAQRSVLIRDGVLSPREMAKNGYTLEDLMEEIRCQGADDVRKVAQCSLETSGKISVFLKPEYQPLTLEDAHVQKPMPKMPRVLVTDGFIHQDELEKEGKDALWLREILLASGFAGEKAVFFASLDDQGMLFLQGKEEGKSPVYVNTKRSHA